MRPLILGKSFFVCADLESSCEPFTRMSGPHVSLYHKTPLSTTMCFMIQNPHDIDLIILPKPPSSPKTYREAQVRITQYSSCLLCPLSYVAQVFLAMPTCYHPYTFLFTQNLYAHIAQTLRSFRFAKLCQGKDLVSCQLLGNEMPIEFGIFST